MSEQVIIFFTTAILLIGTPGPATLSLAATSASFGIKRSMPFLFGILFGMALVIIGAVAGMASLLTGWPELRFTLQAIGGIYIIYLAYKIISAPIVIDDGENKKLPSLLDGLVLNLVNPKAYSAFLALFSQFLLPAETEFTSFVITGIACFILAFIIDVAWVMFGGMFKTIFAHPKWARSIRVLFAVLMVGSVALAMLLA